MQMGGHVIALPLFMETFAFFFEAIFLSIYLYTWDRFKNKWTGVFINELTAVIKNAENEPPNITGILIQKCVHLFLNRSQVYKYIPLLD